MKWTTVGLLVALAVATLAGPSRAQTITIGETATLGIADNGNAGLLLAQGPYQLSQAATINSLSFYTTTVSGHLRLGVYTSGTNHNCKGGSLKAQTNAVTPSSNSWNTANVITPVQLPAGSYCLAYEVSSNSTGFRKGQSTGQSIVYYSKSFGAFPATFSSNPATDPYHWSFYATLTVTRTAPTLSVSLNPSNLRIPSTSSVGTIVGQIVPAWSDGSRFIGTVSFASPYFSDGGCFSIDGSLNLITACDLSGDGGTVQNVTIAATQ
jgi:hypothetical protein